MILRIQIKKQSLYRRYQNIFARAKYYESQLKIKLEETQNINSTTLLASPSSKTTTTEGGGGGEKDGTTNDNSSSISKITKPNGKYSQIQDLYHIYMYNLIGASSVPTQFLSMCIYLLAGYYRLRRW